MNIAKTVTVIARDHISKETLFTDYNVVAEDLGIRRFPAKGHHYIHDGKTYVIKEFLVSSTSEVWDLLVRLQQ